MTQIIESVVQQILDLSLAQVNIPLIIVLMFIGYALKHYVKKLDNATIPIWLGIIGIVLSVLMQVPFNPQEKLLTVLVQGIVCAVLATILFDKFKDIQQGIKRSRSRPEVEGQTAEDTEK